VLLKTFDAEEFGKNRLVELRLGSSSPPTTR
jgi:hypothetical protein